jgi:membrane-associated protease RseP (regulator of RpoE activity)
MDLTPFLLAWRTTALRDRQVVDALVHPSHAAPSPGLAAALAQWPGSHYWSDEPDGRHLILTRTMPGRRPERWTLHAVLFVATLVTTTWAGAALRGVIAIEHSLAFFTLGWRAWAAGLAFSLPLVAILLAHELGHYVTARRYQLDASPPFFIPVPQAPYLPFIGTMGAFIRLRTVLSDRRQLLDVGVAGPIAGFVVALPVLWLGLRMSHPLAPRDGQGLALWVDGSVIRLGDCVVTWLLRRAGPSGRGGLLLHPTAVAGWVGMFVTMLNLLPISQLDGGHILYAALPRLHRRIALAVWVSLLALSRWTWVGWALWAVVVLALSRGRLGHPAVLDSQRPLPASRRWLAWAALALFLLTFMPLPFDF